jgi:hypothetical protein
VEFGDDQYTVEYEDGRRDTVSITWKKRPITSYYDPLNGYKTYVANEKWYFISITNDTLNIGVPNIPPNARDFISGSAFVRVK